MLGLRPGDVERWMHLARSVLFFSTTKQQSSKVYFRWKKWGCRMVWTS